MRGRKAPDPDRVAEPPNRCTRCDAAPVPFATRCVFVAKGAKMRSRLGRRSRVVSIAALVLTAVVLTLFSVTPAAGAQVVDEIISNPAISGQPILIGKRHIASSGTRSAILYVDSLNRPWAYVRDSAAGTSAHL